MKKAYRDLKRGDVVIGMNGHRSTVHEVVDIEYGFVRVYWRESDRPSQQDGSAHVEVA